MKRAAVAIILWGTLGAAVDQPIEKLLHVKVAMRDGVRLDTNVFHPAGTTKHPTILLRTPYGKGGDISSSNRAFIDHGYAVVVQDVRGRHDSEGVFRPYEQEGPDGEDTLAWIARQPWSDGKVGMTGGSYLGMVQWQVAVRNPPQLKAIFPAVSGWDEYEDRFYSRGGAFKLGHRLLWISENLRDYATMAPPDFDILSHHLPLRTADRVAAGKTIDWYQRALDHPSYDGFWKSISIREKLEHLRVPVFSIGGWFDNYAESDLDAFSELRRLNRTAHVMVGPWPHNMADRFTTVDFGAEANAPIRKWQFEWFDHYLKGKDTLAGFVPVTYFTMGENRWHESDTWPPADSVPTPFYLTSKTHANGVSSDGVLDLKRKHPKGSDEFVYDPKNPVPTHGGPICCNFKVLPPGPLDQRAVERRPDVLVYTGEELKRDVEVTGVVKLRLYVSTNAADTDFTAKLVDVYPDGTALSVTDGLLRLRYRDGLEKPELAKAGEVYPITIDAGPTSQVFLKGHRIRLEVSSSNFPRFDRNPNTGRPIADETELRAAKQTVYHGGVQTSALILPVVSRTKHAHKR